ncbi:MAG: hypothetical protein HYV09_02750 [Deltaproteobacteria bacterium]|nr:hypothetical protein [Deltaproteobacteria bacterium]
MGVASCSLAAPSDDVLIGRCRGPVCAEAGTDPTVVAWLRTQRSGYCATTPKHAVALCVSSSVRFENPNVDDSFCFDDQREGRGFLRRPYPRGIALDVGFHWDGARGGNVVTFGSSDYLSLKCDPAIPGRRIVIGIDEGGRLWASGPETSVLRDEARLRPGTHLVSYRVSSSANALYVDGRPIGSGSGTAGVTVEFPERWSPGFVLGDHNQRWWLCSPSAPSRWLRMAGFFVHLRDDAGEVLRFDAEGVLTPGDATVLLFDPSGPKGPAWFPSAGVGWESDTERNHYAGIAYGPVWVGDVWGGCLALP